MTGCDNMMKAWKVVLRGQVVDTVFYDADITAETVRRQLIDKDGFDPEIEVSPMMSKKAYIVNRFQRNLEMAQAEIAEFTAKMAVDAAYTLSWGTSVFQAAAKERVLKQLLASIEQGDDVVAIVTDRVIHKAKYPAQSTSPTSNLIEQYELAALAEVLSAISTLNELI